MIARVRITEKKTGREVTIEDDFGPVPYFMWTDGNYGCDCNRFLFFERALGHDPDFGDCPPCGEELYEAEVLWVKE